MAKYAGGVTVSGYIAPSDTADVYATHKATFGQGGYRSATDLTVRDAITPLRREEGMIVYVISEKKEYRLEGGILNTNWVEVVSSGGGSSKQNYLIFATSIDRDAYTASSADVELGQLCYLIEDDTEYRLINGTGIADWVAVGVGDQITEITKNYYNTIGCLNTALIHNVIINKSSFENVNYVDESGATIISGEDVNEFNFLINSTDYWVGDWIPFYGKTYIDDTAEYEVFLEITQNGNTTQVNILDYLSGNITIDNFKLYGNKVNWYGYFRRTAAGRIDIKTYETIDGVRNYNINKSLYIYTPTFSIMDGTSTTPSNIIITDGVFNDKSYSINVLENTSLTVTLARVQVTSLGINSLKYSPIVDTTKLITENTDYVIDKSIFENKMFDGNFALVVTGTDSGTTIPAYFYGPIVFKKSN